MSHGQDNPYREQCGCPECMPDLSAQAEMQELGPCGKHPKMFWEGGCGCGRFGLHDKVQSCGYAAGGRCSICKEIRLAVEKALQVADDKKYVNRNMTGICICGAPSGRHFESDPSCPETGCLLIVIPRQSVTRIPENREEENEND